MKTIIAGSREITDYEFVEQCIIDAGFDITAIVCGKARGVDSLGEQYGIANNIPIHEYPALWKEFGKAAGHIRNEEMAKVSEALIAIWDGKSNGTKNMISHAKTYKLKTRVYIVDVIQNKEDNNKTYKLKGTYYVCENE